MPDPAYRVARQVARRLCEEAELTPPFDLERLARQFALVFDEELPVRADVVAIHAETSGDRPRIALDVGLADMPDRRRFALAHALGHVLLGWHPLGDPCDVATPPQELPVTAHDLVEGEANAFARELLLPTAWIASLEAFDRPAELMRHVGERGGVPLQPAARAVALALAPGHVWAVTDRWERVLDAGRSPGTTVRPPEIGQEFDGRRYARAALERQHVELSGCRITVWRFATDPGASTADASGGLPRDRSARDVAMDIAADLGWDAPAADALVARIDGIAGWANEQMGTSSLAGMTRTFDERARTVPELAPVAAHPDYDALVTAKAVELVTRRIAR